MSHLVVLLHGLNGSPSELFYLKERLEATFESGIVVEIPDCNYNKTTDGILQGSNRLLQWLQEYLNDKKFEWISFIGHSLGGIYARALVGLMHQGKMLPDRLRPANFITLATPHLGARQHVMIKEEWHRAIVTRYFGQTVLELTVTDFDHENSFMYSLTESFYMKPLELFPQLIAYSNTKLDFTVNFETGAIRRRPFPHRTNQRIVYDDELEIIEDPKGIEDKIHAKLSKLHWQRYAVIPYRPFLAHTDIIVRQQYGDERYGEHIAQHLCERFVIKPNPKHIVVVIPGEDSNDSIPLVDQIKGYCSEVLLIRCNDGYWEQGVRACSDRLLQALFSSIPKRENHTVTFVSVSSGGILFMNIVDQLEKNTSWKLAHTINIDVPILPIASQAGIECDERAWQALECFSQKHLISFQTIETELESSCLCKLSDCKLERQDHPALSIEWSKCEARSLEELVDYLSERKLLQKMNINSFIS
jgi:hypothetical protein